LVVTQDPTAFERSQQVCLNFRSHDGKYQRACAIDVETEFEFFCKIFLSLIILGIPNNELEALSKLSGSQIRTLSASPEFTGKDLNSTDDAWRFQPSRVKFTYGASPGVVISGSKIHSNYIYFY
jgi:hypothetical protein